MRALTVCVPESHGATHRVAMKSNSTSSLALLGLNDNRNENQTPNPVWPSRSQLALSLKIDREQINRYLKAAHERWKRDATLTQLRSDIENIITREGGVVSLQELATSILLTRGSVEEEPLRSTQAIAVVRAVMETEGIMADPRFVVRREGSSSAQPQESPASTGMMQTAGKHELSSLSTKTSADYAIKLGDIADELAAQDPLVPPDRVLEQLRSVSAPSSLPPLPDNRLLRIAAGASGVAAVSSRQELVSAWHARRPGTQAVPRSVAGNQSIDGPRSQRTCCRSISRKPAAARSARAGQAA